MRKINSILSIALALALCLGILVPSTAFAEEAAAIEGPINVYTRDAASGTREGFEKVIDFEGKLTDSANEVSSNGDMAAKVGQDVNAIGYCSMSTDFEANNVRPVNYQGVEANVKNTVSGDYQLARPFAFTTRSAEDYESPEKEQLVEAFIAFLTQSVEGKEAILNAGGVVDPEDGTPWDELKADYPIVEQDNSALEIVTVGSTSVEKVVNAALENFAPLAGGFQFRMNQTGSGDGWKRVLGEEKDGPNKGDIGFASRNFKDTEPVEEAITSGILCQDAIVVIVNSENTTIEDLSKAQLYAIFTGALAEWSEVADFSASLEGPINIYTRDSASGTREGFEKVIGFEGELTDSANEVSSNGDMAAKIGQDANAIGYVSLTTDFAANNISPLSYEGVEANVKNTVSGDYKLARPFVYTMRSAEDYESPEKEQLVEAFITFMTQSVEGKEALLNAGGIVDPEDGTPWDELKADYPIVEQDNSALEIVTVGSTSVEKVVNAALENFAPLAGGFQFRMNQTGSGDGWKRVLGEEKDGPNKGDIGFASRDFKDTEPVEEAAMSGTLCKDAIVVVVNAENHGLSNSTQEQLYDIFTGAIADWSELGEAKQEVIANEPIEGPFNVYTRDSASGTREGFEKVVDFEGELTDSANEVSSNGDMAAKVGQDVNAIGYCSLSTDFEANNILPVSYEGVEPTIKNTVSGDYKLARPFVYTMRSAEDYESPEKEQLVEAFIVFMTQSVEGKEAILNAGGIVDPEDGTPWDELKADYPIVEQDNSALEMVTVGSTSVEKVVNAALENFAPLAGGFQFRMNQTGSGDGWKRVLGEEKDGPNKGDLGFASRNFKDTEPVEEAAMSGTLCQDAIVVVVNTENAGIHNLSQAQLHDIFTGAMTDWSELK